MPTRILYLVHGATPDNETLIASGWKDIDLSKLGRKQAKEQGELLAHQSFDVIICSDLKRATQTVEIGFGNKFKVAKDRRLRECNYGDWNGKPNSLQKDKLIEFVNKPFPNGESLEDVKARVQNLLDDIKNKYDGKYVCLLAHQKTQLALEVLLNGKTWQQAIDSDWRKTMAWQPGWKYELK